MESLDIAVSPFSYVLVVQAILGLGLLLLVLDVLQTADSNTWLVRGFHRLRLGRARLGKVLQRLGVFRYAHDPAASTVDLKACAARCQKCPSVGHCDRLLRQQELCVNDFRFCPNHEYLKRLVSVRPMVAAGCGP